MAHIENNFLVFDNEKIKMKKITGSRVGKILGVDEYDKRGDCLLSMFGLIKTDVDEFYQVRGEIAENIVDTFFKRKFDTIHYNPKEMNYDMFKDNNMFGGVIDVELPKVKTLIEVKAKNIKDYDKVLNYGVKSQELQGQFYGYLKGYEYIVMAWVFFDNDLEDLIKQQMQNSKQGLPTRKFNKNDLKNIKIITRKINVNKESLEPQLIQAYNYAKWCFDNKRIPLEDINNETLKKLNL